MTEARSRRRRISTESDRRSIEASASKPAVRTLCCNARDLFVRLTLSFLLPNSQSSVSFRFRPHGYAKAELAGNECGSRMHVDWKLRYRSPGAFSKASEEAAPQLRCKTSPESARRRMDARRREFEGDSRIRELRGHDRFVFALAAVV